MNASLLLAGLLTVLAPPLETAETPKTRLFVCTAPPGAKIVVDGQPRGESDKLIPVSPGIRSVSVELDGYYPREKQVRARDGWITRVHFKLKRRPARSPLPSGAPEGSSAATTPAPSSSRGPRSAPPDRSGAASKAASAYVTEATLPDPLRTAMLTVLRQHPTEARWSGRSETTVFALAVKALPSGEVRQRASPALLELTHMLAVHELLKAKSILDRYAATGLTDATTLRQAVEEAAGKLEVVGRVRGVVNRAAVRDGFAVAYVTAEESGLTAHLLQPTELEKVRVAYRLVMHRQARELMDRSNWSDALLLWQHLHQQKLVSQALYLDAARCFHQIGNPEDAVRVLKEALGSLGNEATVGFLEQAGDLALSIETDEAQDLAAKAYEMACDKLSVTVSDGTPETTVDDPLK